MVNINNLFDFCNDSIICNDVIFRIGDSIGNTLLLLAIKNNDNHIYKYSNEWLYLINNYYPVHNYYSSLINFYNIIINNKSDIQIINEDVLSFITCFSTGTVHGYSGLYYILSEYLNNIEKYKDLKIIVFKDSQFGILNIIEHMINRNLIDKNKIIYLSQNTTYHFHSITFIENKHHVFDSQLAYTVSNLINKYIIPDRNDIDYYKSLNLPDALDNICIIKGSNSHNVTNDGVINNNIILNLSEKFKLTIVEPNIIHEVHLIHIINKCKFFVTTWGSAFMKNYIYISDDCIKIVVLIIMNTNYVIQYEGAKNSNNLILKYKNADIIYTMCDINLNVDI